MEEKDENLSISQLFNYVTPREKFIMAIGSIATIISGFMFPLM